MHFCCPSKLHFGVLIGATLQLCGAAHGITPLSPRAVEHARDYRATADPTTGRIQKDIASGQMTLDAGNDIYGYVGNTGPRDNVYVICFQLPNFPADETIDSATIAVLLNDLRDGGRRRRWSAFGAPARPESTSPTTEVVSLLPAVL